MKKIKVQDAVGMELCHDITEMNESFKGAAIKLPTTVFDVLLPQIFSGDRISKEELIGLADGGLCQMCKSCHCPNCTFGRY